MLQIIVKIIIWHFICAFLQYVCCFKHIQEFASCALCRNW